MLAGDLETLAIEIENGMPRVDGQAAGGSDLTLTARAKRVLANAMDIAREMHHTYVGSEHLLLGVLREGQAVGAQLLAARGVSEQQALAVLWRVLGAPDMVVAGHAPLPTALAAEIVLEMKDGTTHKTRVVSLREAVRFLALHQLPH